MYISNKKYRLAELRREDVLGSAKLLTKSFLYHNKIWNGYGPTEAEVFDFMVNKTNEMLDTQNKLIEEGVISSYINFIYLNQNGNIVGVCTNYQLEHYLNTLKSTVSLHHFNTLEKIGLELEKSIKKEDIVKGRNLYGMFGSIDDQLMGSGAVFLFFYDIGVYCKGQGLQYLYGRCSNVKSYSILMKMGGEMTAKIKFKDEAKPHEYTVSFVKIPFDSYDQKKVSMLISARL